MQSVSYIRAFSSMAYLLLSNCYRELSAFVFFDVSATPLCALRYDLCAYRVVVNGMLVLFCPIFSAEC